MKTISIITNKKVDTTFNGVECLLRRTINKQTKVNGIRRYTIVTDRCNYKTTTTPITEEVEVIDENGETIFETKAVLDDLGEPTYNVVTILVSLGIKDSTTSKTYTDIQADGLYDLIKDNVSLENGYSNFVSEVEQYGLLLGTQQDLAWGISADNWEILK